MKRREAWLSLTVIALLAVVAWLAFERVTDVPAGAMSGGCIADSIGRLQRAANVPPCTLDDWECRLKCRAGSAGACLGLAYAAERDSKRETEAAAFYQRACLLGRSSSAA